MFCAMRVPARANPRVRNDTSSTTDVSSTCFTGSRIEVENRMPKSINLDFMIEIDAIIEGGASGSAGEVDA